MPAASNVPPSVHPDCRVRTARQPSRKPQAHLVHARPRRAEPAGKRNGVAHMVEVAVGHQEQVAALDRIGRARALRVGEERVDDDRLAARRADLEAAVAVPGERRVAVERHAWTPPGSMLQRGYTRPRVRHADRPESRLRQLDRADRSRARDVRRDRAPSPPDDARPRATSASRPCAPSGSGSSPGSPMARCPRGSPTRRSS